MASRSAAAAIVALALAIALTAGACAGPDPTTPTPSVATVLPGASTSGGVPAASPDTVVDAGLLGLLPAEVAGVPITPDLETASEIAGEGSVDASVSAIAVATAFGPPGQDGEGDYVVITVVRLRPDRFDDAFFRDWRDTFDAAVCDQAGGVTGRAEAEIAGHPTWIGTCTGGVHTYHATLQDDSVIVSMQGLGEGRFGELIVAGLTE
jgi:hypothetical protein